MLAVTLNGWILALHLLAAFALVGSLTLYAIATVAARRIGDPQQALALGRVVVAGTIALRAGLVGAPVFGIWLVFIIKGYSLSNGWIVAALVLWLVVGALGDRSVVEWKKATRLAQSLSASGREGPDAELRGALRSRAVVSSAHGCGSRGDRDPRADDLEAGRMSVFATIRPAGWDLPLFLHVLGAMLLVGAAATGVRGAFVSGPAQAAGWTRRFAYRTFLLAALPAFVLMRVGAEWMRIKEFGSGVTPHFVIIGYTAADGGGGFWSWGSCCLARRTPRQAPPGPGGCRGSGRRADRLARRGVGDGRQAELTAGTCPALPPCGASGRGRLAAVLFLEAFAGRRPPGASHLTTLNALRAMIGVAVVAQQVDAVLAGLQGPGLRAVAKVRLCAVERALAGDRGERVAPEQVVGDVGVGAAIVDGDPVPALAGRVAPASRRSAGRPGRRASP